MSPSLLIFFGMEEYYLLLSYVVVIVVVVFYGRRNHIKKVILFYDDWCQSTPHSFLWRKKKRYEYKREKSDDGWLNFQIVGVTFSFFMTLSVESVLVHV